MIDTDFTLFHGLASTCSKKVRMTLYEKGLAFKSRLMNLQAFEQHHPDYLKINPNGVVPALLDGDAPVIESSIIMEYIDDRYPQVVPLVPADPLLRAKMRLWLRFSDNVAFDAIMLSTWARLSVKRAQSLSSAELKEVIDRIPTRERRDRWAKIAADGFTDAEVLDAHNKMVNCLQKLEAGLCEGAWLVGAKLTLADIANIPFIERIRTLHPELMAMGRYPALEDWVTRMRARPSFDKAFCFTDDPRVADLPKL